MRIALVISAITAGGAERVMVTLANRWAAQGWPVYLITADDGTSAPFYPLHERVEHRPLGVLKRSHSVLASVNNNVRYLQALRSALKACSPDVAISFITESNIRTLLAASGLRVPILVSERNDPQRQKRHAIWRMLSRVLYPTAGKVVVQTAAVKETFSFVPEARLAVIPNPVKEPERGANTSPTPEFELKQPLILAVGRLEHQKGFDLLLKAYARFLKRHPQWNLLILGEGSKREELSALAKSLGIHDSVSLPGVVNNVEPYFHHTNIFVLSSRYEGIPNALCEAMVAGIPAVVTACSSGPIELIEDKRNGLLVPPENVEALCAALTRLAEDSVLCERLGREAKQIAAKYAVDHVLSRWEEAINEARRSIASNRSRRVSSAQ